MLNPRPFHLRQQALGILQTVVVSAWKCLVGLSLASLARKMLRDWVNLYDRRSSELSTPLSPSNLSLGSSEKVRAGLAYRTSSSRLFLDNTV